MTLRSSHTCWTVLQRVLGIAGICGLVLGPARSEEAFLSVSRADLVQLLDDTIPTFEAAGLQTFEVAAQQERTRLADKKRRRDQVDARILQARSEVNDGEQIWALFQSDIPVQLTAVGKGDKLFAIRIGFPMVNARQEEQERAFAFLSRLFERTYDGSREMGQWPERSLGQAWQARVGPDGKELVWDPATALVRIERDGVISATFGTPPDFVVYLITARQECLPPPVFRELVARVVC